MEPVNANAPELPDIDARSIEAAEAIHGLRFTPEQRGVLAADLVPQRLQMVALRNLERSLDLQPALHFDPRLPGVSYPPQYNLVRLAAAPNAKLPKSDADIAFAPVTQRCTPCRS
jgi:hypothetical protein